jgi:hypothetical protein
VGVWGSTALVGQRSRARRLEIPQRMEQHLCRPMERGLACSACYCFSVWWYGEASHELGVWSADVSALPGVLPLSSKSQASYQSPWITEVRRSVAMFWSPSWILPCTCVLQPTLVHLYHNSSLLPELLPTVASARLRLLHLLLYSERINHIQVLGFLLFPYSSYAHSPLTV